MKILFIGDIVGKPGRRALQLFLKKLQAQHGVALTIANGENAAGGFGITPSVADELFKLGIDVITSGNHIWDKKEILPYITKENRLLRPLNYPPGTPGFGSVVISTRDGTRVGVLNLTGRVFINPADCPFRSASKEIETMFAETAVRIVDFHAEATSEKISLGRFLDGQASAVIGTHTHVQTADEQLLPSGTAYITDVGMTGPSESVIGVKTEIVIRRFLTGIHEKFDTATQLPQFQAVLLDIDPATGRAEGISRISLRSPSSE
jgi:metallophosphoesterase (TIGR00282 family)